MRGETNKQALIPSRDIETLGKDKLDMDTLFVDNCDIDTLTIYIFMVYTCR